MPLLDATLAPPVYLERCPRLVESDPFRTPYDPNECSFTFSRAIRYTEPEHNKELTNNNNNIECYGTKKLRPEMSLSFYMG